MDYQGNINATNISPFYGEGRATKVMITVLAELSF